MRSIAATLSLIFTVAGCDVPAPNVPSPARERALSDIEDMIKIAHHCAQYDYHSKENPEILDTIITTVIDNGHAQDRESAKKLIHQLQNKICDRIFAVTLPI